MQLFASMQHDLHCGAITYLAGQKTLDTHWEQAIEQEEKMRRYLFPWLEAETAASRKQLTGMWERAYGSPDDPDVQKKIADTVAQMHKRAEQGRQSPVDTRLGRKVKKR